MPDDDAADAEGLLVAGSVEAGESGRSGYAISDQLVNQRELLGGKRRHDPSPISLGTTRGTLVGRHLEVQQKNQGLPTTCNSRRPSSSNNDHVDNPAKAHAPIPEVGRGYSTCPAYHTAVSLTPVNLPLTGMEQVTFHEMKGW